MVPFNITATIKRPSSAGMKSNPIQFGSLQSIDDPTVIDNNRSEASMRDEELPVSGSPRLKLKSKKSKIEVMADEELQLEY